ncbi:MAG: M20/M25/M40 family metallo-hydrolase [Terriglobales bacterium]
MSIRLGIKVILAALIVGATLAAEVRAANDQPTQAADMEAMTRIRQEGFRHSQVMQTMSELSDRIGPRLTGSPELKEANEWTKNKLSEWGLANAHLESWGPFGRGWQEEFTSVRMIAPDIAMLHAIPRGWTPGTDGVVRAKVVRVKIEKKEDLEKYRGKLGGMLVLSGEMREVKASVEPLSERYTDKKLEEIEQFQIPGERSTGPFNPEERRKRMELAKLVSQFFLDEKVVAVFEPSQFDEGLITMSGTQAYKPGEPLGVPTLNMAVENYGRITRLLEREVPVELELNVQTKFFDDDPMAYNTIAEIPGTDKKDEIVMLGAHLDSWHGGTGATDNGAGSAAVMEAVRILKMAGIKPRRTIRIALWTGEEEGLLGSRAYVKEHFASRPDPTDPKEKELPEFLRRPTGPLQLKPEYAKLAAYFNIDNGTGKLRGIYMQENAAVWPIFEKWIEYVKDLGVSTVTMRNTGGTDHLSFDSVGLPGFQFIQDPIEYSTRTHHTNMDVYERLQREDLMQQAVVMAWFVYNAAMRDEMLPRAPLPRQDPPAGPAK